MNVKIIGVIGAGQMGAGIAQIAAGNGYSVILRDIKKEFCTRAIDKMRAGLEKRLSIGKITQDDIDRTIDNISCTTEMSDLCGCDLVIEAAPEVLELKQEIFKDLSRICRPNTIFCTNTSSMSVEEIMSHCQNKERCIGMHFFFPVTIMKLVELIRCSETSDATVSVVSETAAGMKKTAVECRMDRPGFIVNRCLFAFMLEAIRCYTDGIATPEDIDTAMKLGLNHPMGPFEMMDLSGLDTFTHVCDSLEGLEVTGWSCPDVIEDMVKAGRFGRKAGSGWYEYK